MTIPISLANKRMSERVIIIGGPGTGKTTYARQFANVLSTDDLHKAGVSWSDASAEIVAWMNQPGPWAIEGVAVVRAVRKWLKANPGKPLPIDRVIVMKKQYIAELSPGAAAMGKAHDTVLKQIRPYLRDITVETVGDA